MRILQRGSEVSHGEHRSFETLILRFVRDSIRSSDFKSFKFERGSAFLENGNLKNVKFGFLENSSIVSTPIF